MEIDDTLKNRLAGAAVITVLAVIFLPMLFDDPVEKKGQVVSELDIPRKPEVSPLLTTAIVPEKTSEAVAAKSLESAAPANVVTDDSNDLTDDTEKSDAGMNTEELPLNAEQVKKEESQSASKTTHKTEIVDAVDFNEPTAKEKSSKSTESQNSSAAEEEEPPPPKKKSHKKEITKSEKPDEIEVKEPKSKHLSDEVKKSKSKEVKSSLSSEDIKVLKPKEPKKEDQPKVAEKKIEKVKPEQPHPKSQLPTLDVNALDKADSGASHTEANAGKHRWIIQVVSLSDKAKAEAFKDKLRTQGFPATIDSVWLNGKGRVYRLKVGPELDAERAQSMKTKINQLNGVHSIAIPE
jgi:DedD protein